MSDFARLRLSLEVSESSDYSSPYVKPPIAAETLTPDEVEWRMVEATTSGDTIDLSMYDSIEALILVNDDSTNGVSAVYYTIVGSQGAGDLAFANADPDTIADNNTNGTFITNGAADGRYVQIANSENSGENDGTFLIQNAVDGDNLTLAAQETLTANTNDTTATLQFLEKNYDLLDAGQFAKFCTIDPENDIVLTSSSGTVRCYLGILGS